MYFVARGLNPARQSKDVSFGILIICSPPQNGRFTNNQNKNMSSFLEKLKKGTKSSSKAEIEEMENYPDEENENEIEDEEEEENQIKTPEESEVVAENPAGKKRPTVKKIRKLDKKLENLEVKSIPAIEETVKEESEDNEWLETEGQLGIDMYQTENELIVQSAIAGVKTEELDVLIEDDVLTIKGTRNNPYRIDSADYFIQECYWGRFSRKIILPVEVDASKTDAQMRDGILTVRIPKLQRESKKRIVIKN